MLLIRVDRAFTEFELGSVVEKSLDCFVLWQVREIVLLLVGCYLVIEVLKEQVCFCCLGEVPYETSRVAS